MLSAPGAHVDRRGVSLVEIVVSLALTGVVLAMVSAVALRQQRFLADLGEQSATAARLREAAAILPIQLRAARPGDIREARDTSLELRATIATAIVCDTEPSIVILEPATNGEARYASFVSPIEAGDSLWILTAGSNTPEWTPLAVLGVGSRSAGVCAVSAPPLADEGLHRARVALSVAALPAGVIGMPVRVTRPTRYSLYRSTDGWYLGQRDWSNATARFASIQPVAGPLLSASDHGLSFSYTDSSGSRLDRPVPDVGAIAGIRIELRAQTTNPARPLTSADTARRKTDSTILIVALRNRR
jgi:hypothetical protein